MAGSVNKVILIGRLGADPEVRYTPSGTPVANFRIATSDSWNDKQGQRQERTEWHRIVAWSKLAELCGEYLAKGRQVYVEGRLQTRQWDDRDGNKRYTTEIQAREITFLGGREGEPKRQSGPGDGGDVPSAPMGGGGGGNEPGYDYGPPPMTDDDVPF
ncbi:MAG: single-stranded DNA-binding protein [Deltaproteobacteria bacterium RIFOXYA12_FULL_58_15]|nr:MAG: single-stranded DNA-binding protein [Deltaproteobacteria bacterium RIFOXYA12_FULL_58_15]